MSQSRATKKKQQKAKARQRAVARKTAVARQRGAASLSTLMTRAAAWPMRECLLPPAWDDPTSLTEVVVARSAAYRTAAAIFLVDLQCLGVKNCAVWPDLSDDDYRDLVERVASRRDGGLRPCDPDLAAAIVTRGVEYASDLGFAPHPDYSLGAPLLAGLNPQRFRDQVVCGGEDGKPRFIAGPYDDARWVVERLRDRLGEGGFHYLVPVGAEEVSDEFEPALDRLVELLRTPD